MEVAEDQPVEQDGPPASGLPPSSASTTSALATELAARFAEVTETATVPFESQFHALFEHLPETAGKMASRREREAHKYQSSTLIYGEIDFRAFAAHFLKIKRKYGGLREPGGVFVDIGCGSGELSRSRLGPARSRG